MKTSTQTKRIADNGRDVNAELPGWEQSWQDLADHLCDLHGEVSPTPTDETQAIAHSTHDACVELPGREQQRQDLADLHVCA